MAEAKAAPAPWRAWAIDFLLVPVGLVTGVVFAAMWDAVLVLPSTVPLWFAALWILAGFILISGAAWFCVRRLDWSIVLAITVTLGAAAFTVLAVLVAYWAEQLTNTTM